jgi:superfamily I DNA/RNA helicase
VKTVSILELVNERVEAETIARLIEQLIGGSGFHSIDMGTVKDANLIKSNSYADFAILYRTNDQHRVIAQVFEACGIPFQIVSRDHALNQKGLPETISFFKIIEGNGGFLDYEKAIQFTVPGIGKKAGEQFKAWCYQNCFSLQEGLSKAVRFPISGLASSKQQQLNAFFKKLLQYKSEMNSMSVADKLLFLKKNTKLSDILKTDTQVQDAFSRLVEFARQFDTHTTDFFTATDLHADTDTYVPRVEKVSLMTMHAAKGLEFPIVFIAGCEENLIPYRRSDHEQADIEEERRLFYVAMTRAMERLYLTRAKKRRIYGKTHDRELSSFVTDIEQKLKKDETPLFKKRKTENHQVQLKLF